MDANLNSIFAKYNSGATIDTYKQEINQLGETLFKSIINVYPEYIWLEKYVIARKCSLVPEINCLYVSLKISLSQKEGFSAIWLRQADADLCASLIEALNFPITTLIKQKNSTKHIVLIVGYNKENHYLRVHDPLGNYHSDYFDPNGAYISFSYDQIEQIGVGNPMSIFFSCPIRERDKIFKMLNQQQYYYIAAEEILIQYRLSQLAKFC